MGEKKEKRMNEKRRCVGLVGVSSLISKRIIRQTLSFSNSDLHILQYRE